MDSLSYAVVGAGALGGLYGGMLAKSGRTVRFLLRSDFDHVRQHGWKVESRWGDFHLPQIDCYKNAGELPPSDVTIVGLKTTENDRLPDLLSQSTRGGGRVLVLQNGLGIEEAAANVVGPDRVMTGCCFLCSNKVGPGHIKHLDHGRIVFGNYERQSDAWCDRVREDLQASGIEVKVHNRMALVRWRKLLWNITFNGLSVALNASSKDLITDPSTLELSRALIDEVAGAARALGFNITDEMCEQTVQSTVVMVPYDSSMRLDYLAGRPLEIEAIFDAPLAAAAAIGHPMPRVRMLRDQLRFLDRRKRD